MAKCLKMILLMGLADHHNRYWTHGLKVCHGNEIHLGYRVHHRNEIHHGSIVIKSIKLSKKKIKDKEN